MGKRSTVYHSLVTPEKWDKVNEKNKNLINEFTDYLRSANKSPATIKQYEAQLRTFRHGRSRQSAKSRELLRLHQLLIGIPMLRSCLTAAMLRQHGNFINK